MTAEIKEGLKLFQKGKTEDALNALKVAYGDRVEEFGADHFATSEVQHLIAMVLEQQGKFEEALYHSREAHRRNAAAFSPGHPAALSILRTIGSILVKQEQYKEALITYQELYLNLKLSFTLRHFETLSAWNNLTTVCAHLGEDVLPLYEEIYNFLKDGNPSNPLTLLVRYNIAVRLSKKERYDEALKILTEINAFHNKSRSRNMDSLDSLNLTVTILNKLGKHEDALEVLEQVLEMKVKMFGTCHPTTLETLQKLSKIITGITDQKSIEEKLECFRNIFIRRNCVLGLTHSETLKTREIIVDMLLDLGKYDDAVSICNAVY